MKTKKTAKKKTAAELDRLRETVELCRQRNFIDADGRVREVAGTLMVSVDGVVLGHGAMVCEIMNDKRTLQMSIGIGVFEGMSTDSYEVSMLPEYWHNYDKARHALIDRKKGNT